MGQLSSTPQRETPIRLEQRKSYSVGLWFQATDLGGNLHNVDLTGSTIEFVVRAQKRKGGAVVIDQDAVLTDPTVGLARLDLQAADLDLDAGEYPYSATLFDADGYSIVFLKGFVEVLENTNAGILNEFVGDDPSTELHVELTHDNRVTVTLWKGMKGDKGDPGEDGLDGQPGTTDYNELENTPDSLPPSGPAGGVLAGTFPNPEFAVPMADMGHVQQLQEAIDQLDLASGGTSEGLDDEIAARIAGDLAVKAEILGGAGPAYDTLLEFQNLFGETSADIADLLTQIGLKANQTDLDDESTTRADDDAAILDEVTAEGVARAAADIALDLDITAETSSRIAGDAALGIEIDELDAQVERDYKDMISFKREEWRNVVSSDIAEVTLNSGADAAFNRNYSRGLSDPAPATWPVQNGRGSQFFNGAGWYAAAPTIYGNQFHRFYTDADEFMWYGYGALNDSVQIKVNGQPLSQYGFKWTTASGAKYNKVKFLAGAKVRLIELEGALPVHNLYVKKPYTIWKGPPVGGPSILVFGDSYTSPAVYENDGATFNNAKFHGMWQGMAPLLGVDEILVDGYGGSGYTVPGSGASYLDRITVDPWDNTIPLTEPDVIVMHGGGANDFYNIGTDPADIAAVHAAVVAVFTELRDQRPNAKLVFVEGLAPPTHPFGAAYLSLRALLLADATMDAIGVYYLNTLDDPWLKGLGKITAPNGDGENANIYIGSDGAHYTIAGAAYFRSRAVPAMRKILRDRGALVNTLVGG